MCLPKSITQYKAVVSLLLTLLFATSCSVQQRNTSLRQSKPNAQLEDIGKQQNSTIQKTEPIPLDALPTEPLRQSEPSAQVKDLEKKLGVTILDSDPDIPLYTEAAKWIGTRYKYSGMSEGGVDCSGLTHLLYKTVYNKTLLRSSAEMAKHNVKEIAKSLLEPGDLIFFATFGGTKITHVGVYLKDNRFIHASSKVGVVVNNLNEDYYRKTFVKCGRVK